MREDLKAAGMWIAVFVAVVLVAVALCQADEPAPFEPSEVQSHMASLNDTYRVSRGLRPHKLDEDLCTLSQRWAEHMAARGRMYHGGGENIIAYGTSTVPATMSMWRASGPHNGFLLSGTTRAGWGHATSSNGTHYWAGAFRGETSPDNSAGTSTNGGRVWNVGWLFWRRR